VRRPSVATADTGVGLLWQKKGGRSGSLSQNYPKLTGEYLPQKQYPPQELCEKFRYSAAPNPQAMAMQSEFSLFARVPLPSPKKHGRPEADAQMSASCVLEKEGGRGSSLRLFVVGVKM
jgi:hypothetical protein